MKKKFLLSTILALSLSCNIALAQTVVVEGYGEDKSTAVRSAMRAAVEQVVGTMVDSRTLVDKSVIAMDEIYTKSQGFVKDVKLLEEKKDRDLYQVKAAVDVDTNPRSELQNRIAMIMALNDPRINVNIVFHNNYDGNDQKAKYPMLCEASMNNKLIELGFGHIVVSDKFTKDIEGVRTRPETDYIVLGKLDIISNNLTLPNYKDFAQQTSYNRQLNTGLIRASAELDVEVIKSDNKDVIGHFRVEAQAIKDTVNNSENDAVKQVSQKAAEELRKIFSRKAANISSNLQVVARTNSYNQVMKLEDILKNMAGINSAIVRSYENGKGVIDLDTELKPQVIFKLLKQQSEISVFLENFSGNIVEISL